MCQNHRCLIATSDRVRPPVRGYTLVLPLGVASLLQLAGRCISSDEQLSTYVSSSSNLRQANLHSISPSSSVKNVATPHHFRRGFCSKRTEQPLPLRKGLSCHANAGVDCSTTSPAEVCELSHDRLFFASFLLATKEMKVEAHRPPIVSAGGYGAKMMGSLLQIYSFAPFSAAPFFCAIRSSISRCSSSWSP